MGDGYRSLVNKNVLLFGGIFEELLGTPTDQLTHGGSSWKKFFSMNVLR